MKTRDKILFATALIAVAGLFVYAARHHKKTDRMLSDIADEGYETAPDLLFPNKAKKHDKLRYGPVLPS
jgi:hypothetical protein